MIDKIKNISASGASIYDSPDPASFLTDDELESALKKALIGLDLSGLPIRSRSKFVKTKICIALGYPVPATFDKTQPRFPVQDFDVYTQKSNNLQIWNEDVSPTRRYVLIKTNNANIVTAVKVVRGEEISLLDKTGTLTQKYQATYSRGKTDTELYSKSDTDAFLKILESDNDTRGYTDPSPTSNPDRNTLPIDLIFDKMQKLIGAEIDYRGADQERNRGASLHILVCQLLGYDNYADSGQFPDITNQLLEIKLQTSPTIDLGKHSPDSEDIIGLHEKPFRYCDVRYLIVSGKVDGDRLVVTDFSLITGADFFKRFRKFGGKTVNKKIQIPLPGNFFG